MSAPLTPWVLKPAKGPALDARLRLFCFPQAGSGAWMYGEWQAGLPDWVEVMPVELPGRNSRAREAPITDLPALAAAAAEALLPLLQEKPFCFFGHSMGAWLAFELTRELERRGGPLPLALYASANRSPALAGQANDVDPVQMHRLPAKEFWAHFEARYGASPEMADRHMRAFAERQLRTDFQAIETYRPPPAGYILPCPLTVLGSHQDPRYRLDQLEAWQALAPQGQFRLQLFDGAHNYVDTHRAELLEFLSADLGRLLPAPASTSSGGLGGDEPAGAIAAPTAAAVAAASTAAAAAPEAASQHAAAVPGEGDRSDWDELPISTEPSSGLPPPPSQAVLQQAAAALLAQAELQREQEQEQAAAAVIAVEEDASEEGGEAGGAPVGAAVAAVKPASRTGAPPGVASMKRSSRGVNGVVAGPGPGPGPGPGAAAAAAGARDADERMCAGVRRELRTCCWWWG